MKKTLNIIIKVILVIILIILLFITGLRTYFRFPVSKFYRNSEKSFIIPDSNKNYIAQGLTYSEEDGNFYLTGYMKDHSASPIYIVNKESKKLVKSLKIQNPDGSEFTGHNGGLTIFQNKIIITGGENKCLYVFDKNLIDSAENKSFVTYEKSLSLEADQDYISSAFTSVIKEEDGDLLVTGEFYRDPNYKTLESHTVDTSDGQNKALAVAYKVEEDNLIPVKAFSIRGLVQGMAFDKNKVYLSTSWGTAFSYIYVYDLDKIEAESKNIMGKDIPLYVLDSKSQTEAIKLFPMAEEIEILDNKLYIMNESASNKYIFGKFTSGKFCYYTDLD
ncbi:MAG: hypothetical protein K5866_01365 [Treponema sp.]|nr:hypothetical protein [Treponema sp.]